MVLGALEEARQNSTAPVSLYTEVLLQRVKEVHHNSGKMFPHNHITYLFGCFYLYANVMCWNTVILIIQMEKADSDVQIKSGWVLDNFPRTNSQMYDLQQSGILPDTLICLSDPDENHGVRLKQSSNQCILLILAALKCRFNVLISS